MTMLGEISCIVRADGNAHLGMGHMVRCLTLADELKRQGARILVMTRDADGPVRTMIDRQGYEVVGIPPAASLTEDLHRLCTVIARMQFAGEAAPLVTLDGYAFSADYQRGVLGTGAILMYVDDVACGPQVAHLVLNQNSWAHPRYYQDLAAHSRLLLGSRYALVRPEFSEAARRWSRAHAALTGQVLVTFGGGDEANVTGQVAKWLAKLEMRARFVLLVGPGYPHLRELRAWVQERPERFTLASAPEDVASLMAQADIAISNAGSTCWELCCLGVPALVIILEEHQVRIAEGLAAAGIADNLGWFAALTAQRLGERLNALLEDQVRRDAMSSLARGLVDGQGAHRVASAMIDILQTPAVRR